MARLGHLDDYFESKKGQALAPAATSQPVEENSALYRGYAQAKGRLGLALGDASAGAEMQRALGGRSPEFKEYLQKAGEQETFLGAAKELAPKSLGDVGHIAALAAEELPSAIPSVAGAAIGRWAGAKAGALTGAALAGPIPVPGARVAGAAIGGIIGMFGGGYAVGKLSENAGDILAKAKDPTNPASIQEVLNDEDWMKEMGDENTRKAFGTAGADALAQIAINRIPGGVAGNIFRTISQIASEPASEAAGQVYEKGKVYDPSGVAIEMVAGLPTALGEAAFIPSEAKGIEGSVKKALDIKRQRIGEGNYTDKELELIQKATASIKKDSLNKQKLELQARKDVAEAVGRAKEKGVTPVGQDVREGFTQDRILAGGDGREAVGSTFISEAEAEERQKRAVKDFIDSQKTGEPRPLPGVLPQAKGIQEQEVLPSVDQRQEEIDKAFDRRERTLAAREEVSEADKEREIDEAFTAREEELAIREEGKEKEEDFDRAKDEVVIREELRKESDKAFVGEQQTQDELEREVPPSPAMEEAFSVAEEQRSAREEEVLPVEERAEGVQESDQRIEGDLDSGKPFASPQWARKRRRELGLNDTHKVVPLEDGFGLQQIDPTNIVELEGNKAEFESDQTFSFSDKGRESLATKKRNTKRIISFLKSNTNLKDATFTTFTPEDMSHLPQSYQDYIKERNPRALFYKNKKEILINLNGFKNTQDIKGGIIHELAGHYGLRKTLGSQFDHFISSALKNKKVKGAMDDFLGERYKGLSSEGRMEEYLSELARTKFQGGELSKSQEGFYKRAIAKIRHILRKLGLVNVSEEDINTVIRNSYAYTVEGEGKGQDFAGEGVAELKERNILYINKDTPVLVNPSKREVYRALKESEAKQLRVVTTAEGDNYLSDAGKTVHEDIHNLLKMSKTQISNATDSYISKDGEDSYVTSVEDFFAGDVAEMSADMMREDAGAEGVSEEKIKITDEAYQAPIHKNEFYNNFSKRFTTMFRDVKRMKKFSWLSSLGGIAAENQYDIITSRSKGAAQEHTKVASALSKQLENLEDTQISIVREQWLNEDEFNIPGASQEVHDALQVAKKDLEGIQVALSQMINPRTKAPYLSKEQLENSRGKYIHKVYWKYYNEYKGANKKTSFMNYLKKEKLAPDVRALAGEVRDAEFLIPNTIATIGRDVAMLEMYAEMDRVSKDYGLFWTLDPADRIDLKFRGENHKWTLKEIEAQIQDTKDLLVEGGHARLHDRTDEDQQALQEQLEYLVDIRKANEGLYIAEVKKGMDAVGWKDTSGNKIIPTDEDARAFLDQSYVRIPSRDKTWGALSGQMVRKEIYQDIVADNEDFDFQNADALKRALKAGGTLDKLTSFWKGTKTIYNPPYWIRNIFGNGYLLDTSSETPSHKLMKMTMEEINNTFSGKDTTWFKHAKRFGLYATTFSSNELYFMQEDFKKRADLRKAIKDNENTLLPRAFYMLSDGYLKSGQWLAEHHSVIEGIFKQTSMRDFVQRWEKSSGNKFESQSTEAKEVILGNAAKHANDSIFDYSKVPGWLRTARRSIVPFATFNYKMAGQLPKALINHPFKMSKYYVAPYLAAQALLHGGDMEEEDWKKVQKDMPHHMKGKSSLFMFPIKDKETGKFKYIDMTYMLPPAIFADPLLKMGSGENPLDILTKDFGVLGGPVPQGLAMFLSNKDPFTGQEIKKPGATTGDNLERVMTQIYSMWMPPVLTQHGVTGRLLDQAAIDMPLLSTGRQKSEFGTDRETLGESLSRLSGLTIGSFNPREARIRNIKREHFNINSARKEMRKQLASQNISTLERLKIRDRYLKEIKQRQSKLREIM